MSVITENFDDSEDGDHKTTRSHTTLKTISSNSIQDSLLKIRKQFDYHKFKDRKNEAIEFDESDKENEDINCSSVNDAHNNSFVHRQGIQDKVRI